VFLKEISMSDHHHEELHTPDRFWQPLVITLGILGVLCLALYHPIIA
jgi:hypothetical protein